MQTTDSRMADASPAVSGAPEPWRGHVADTVGLAVPLVGAQLAQMAMGVTDTVMIGWLGATELAGSVLGTQAYFLLYIFGVGFAQAMLPMAANAEGQGDVGGVRRSIRMGLWILAGFSALMMLPLWHGEAIMLALGQEPEIAAVAGTYIRVVQWGMLPALVVMGLRSYLTVVGRVYVVLAVVSFGAVLNFVLNYGLIFGNFGMPALGVAGAALATTLTSLVMALVLIGYAAAARGLRRYEIFVRFWRADVRALVEILRLGWPIGATIIAEVGLFAASSVMMGWFGAVPLAAHGIALQIASIAFMIPLGLASAATVRVGVAFGRGDEANLGRAGLTALALAAAIAVVGATIFWSWPERLIGFYLDPKNANAEAVLAYAVPLLLVAAAFQTVDSLQAVASGVLRGLKDTRVPLYIALFSYWGVGLPVAWVFGIALGFGGLGVWSGLALGLAAAALLLSGRFVLRDRLGLLGDAAAAA
jgi:MATE family multidrug resistance protein